MTHRWVILGATIAISACRTIVIHPPAAVDEGSNIELFQRSEAQRTFAGEVRNIKQLIQISTECCRTNPGSGCDRLPSDATTIWRAAEQTGLVFRSSLPVDDKARAFEAFRSIAVEWNYCRKKQEHASTGR